MRDCNILVVWIQRLHCSDTTFLNIFSFISSRHKMVIIRCIVFNLFNTNLLELVSYILSLSHSFQCLHHRRRNGLISQCWPPHAQHVPYLQKGKKDKIFIILQNEIGLGTLVSGAMPRWSFSQTSKSSPKPRLYVKVRIKSGDYNMDWNIAESHQCHDAASPAVREECHQTFSWVMF